MGHPVPYVTCLIYSPQYLRGIDSPTLQIRKPRLTGVGNLTEYLVLMDD